MVQKLIPANRCRGDNPHVCSKCLSKQGNSAIIVACSCKNNPYIHQACLQKEIGLAHSQNPTATVPSQYEGFMEYRCPNCKSQILFKENFSKKIIPWSDLTSFEKISFVVLFFVFLFFLGLMVLVVMLCVQGIFQIWVTLLFEGLFLFPVILLVVVLYILITRKFFRVDGENFIGRENLYLKEYLAE